MRCVSSFGALGQADDSATFQLALDYARQYKEAIQVPAGVFQMGAPPSYVSAGPDFFTPGLNLIGEGAGKTTLINNHGGFDLIVATGVDYKFQCHGKIEGITFAGGGCGPKIASAYHYRLQDLHIVGKSAHGLYLPTLKGDADACNMTTLDNVRFDNCAKWGIFGEVTPGVNELSFLTLRSVSINECGSADPSIGGGMYWRGQMLRMDQVAFVCNRNRGLYVEGGAGLGSDIYGSNVTFENNTGMHIQSYGGVNAIFDNLQLYSNDAFIAAYGVKIDASSSLCQNFLVRSAKVRATAGNNPYIAFCATGANLVNARAQNVRWDNFGYAGQTQMLGFTA